MADPGPNPSVIRGAKGQDAGSILAQLESKGIVAVIPPKRSRKLPPVIDGKIYALRNLVEHCFS